MEPSNLLRGTRLRLTALTPDDLPTLARWHQDPTYLRLYDSRPAYPRSEVELAKWLAELQKDKNAAPDRKGRLSTRRGVPRSAATRRPAPRYDLVWPPTPRVGEAASGKPIRKDVDSGRGGDQGWLSVYAGQIPTRPS